MLSIILLVMLATPMVACSTVKKFTGQTDDSILPGQREDILPPESQTARDPAVVGKKAAKCSATDMNCIPPADQESSTPQ